MAKMIRAIAIAAFALPFAVAAPADALTFTGTNVPLTGSNLGTPSALGVGDFDEDGQTDIVAALQTPAAGDLSVLLRNRATGGYGPAPGSPRSIGGSYGGPLEVVDVNGDGHLDLALLQGRDDTLSTVAVLLGDGHGRFGAPLITQVAGEPGGLALGDVTGDGKLDLVLPLSSTGNTPNGSRLAVMPGNGDGTFRPALIEHAALGGQYPGAIVLADFDGDGKLDVAVAHVFVRDGLVTVLRGNGAGGFASVPGSPYDIGSGTFSLSVADLDGDGKLDLASGIVPASGNDKTSTVGALLGNGDGSFRVGPTGSFVTPAAINPSTPFMLPLGDLDGDGRIDAVLPLDVNNAIWPLFGDGAGRFLSPAASPLTAGPILTAAKIADLDGDGRPEILAVGGSSPSRLYLYANDGEQAIDVAASALDLGTRQVGEPAARQTVAVSNPGDYGLRVRTLTVVGADAADFTASGCLDRPIAARQRCDVTVAFAPRAAGARTATLEIDSDAPGAGRKTVALTATGTPAPPSPDPGGGAGDGGTGPGGGDGGGGGTSGGGAAGGSTNSGGAAGGNASGGGAGGGSTAGDDGRGSRAGLRVTVRPAQAKLARGKRARLTVTIGNRGPAAARRVTLCPRVSAKQLTAGRCLRIGTIAAGRSVRRTVTVALGKAARPGRRYTLRLTAKATGAATVTTRVVVSARR